jgi:hypothetical protein
MKTKTLKTLILIMVGSLLMFSCEGNGAKRVAKDFLQTYYIDLNFDEATKLATENSQDHLNERILFFNMNPYSRDEKFTRFEIREVDAQKTKASVIYTVDNLTRKLLLSRIGGQWLVDMPFEVANNGLEFSLSLTKPDTGGFASAESRPMRVGDIPQE